MTNEEAIAIIRNEYKCVDRDCDIERSCGKCDLMMPSKEPILEAYKLAIKAIEQTTWIPVSERLPEDGRYVLFCDIDNDIMVGYHIQGRPNTHFSQDGTWEDMKNVKAWMPLPEPYEPQESEVEE